MAGERIRCGAGQSVRIEQAGPGAGILAISGVVENYETSSISVVLASEPPDSWQRSPVRVSLLGAGQAFMFEGYDVRFRKGEPSWCSIEFDEPMFATESIVHARVNFNRRCGFFFPDVRAAGKTSVAAYSVVGLVDECSLTGMTAAFDDDSGRRLMTDRSLIVNLSTTGEEPLLVLVETVGVVRDPMKRTGVLGTFVFADLDEVVRPALERQVGLRLLESQGLLREAKPTF